MYYVYALLSLSVKNWLYIGYSDDLKTRVATHNNKKVKSTKSKTPLKLVYYEAYVDEMDARRRERELKTHQQKDILKEKLKKSLLRH